MISRVVPQAFSTRPVSVCVAFLIGEALCSACLVDQHTDVADMELWESSYTSAHCQLQQAQDDSTVLLQGRRIKVERVGGSGAAEQMQGKSSASQAATGEPSDKRELDPNELESAMAKALKQIWEVLIHRFSYLENSTRVNRSSGHTLLSLGVNRSSKSSRTIGAFALAMLLICTCISACPIFVLLARDKKPPARNTHESLPNQPRFASSNHSPLASSSLMMSRSGPSTMGSQAPPGSMRTFKSPQQQAPSMAAGMRNFESPQQQAPLMAAGLSPQQTLQTLPNVGQELFQESSKTPEGRLAKPLVPQLCPSLVLPWCQARFGVPMRQLNAITSEGEVRILGMSGNLLMRAAVRMVGENRILEILMPQRGGAPRATIGADNMFIRSGSDQGALVIRGPNGAFYAELELHPNGACYVSRNGERILVIDGIEDSLNISVRSGTGDILASAGFSSEMFGGEDHVEIRVEPGVDTVLVLGCVLACFLFSPLGPR